MSEQSVTLLFTDMVDSTAVASGLGPDAADEMRRRHFLLLRQAVTDNGGIEVKSLGDGLMVVFASASRALSCAVAMQQYVARDGHLTGQGVGLRVGLSGGEVSCEGEDYFGEPVIEAARLCAVCEAGQIVAADIVRLTAGRRTQQVFQSLGELELKGLAHWVSSVEVLWEPLDADGIDGRVPLPGRLGVVPVFGVIGRAGETGVLGDAFARVAKGGGREVCLVSGEAGAGKSTVVAEVARTAFDDGACVLYGHCEEDLAAPYQLFSQTLSHFVKYAPDDRLAVALGAGGAAGLARLVPELSKRFPELGSSTALDADTERYQLHASVVDLIASVSLDQPIVMVMEDLQWADSASLQLLRHVVAADDRMRLLILATYRDSELQQTQHVLETLAALHRQHGVAQVRLAGLDNAGVVSLMEAAAGHDLGDEAAPLAQAIYRETDGNPFFVTELLRHLAESDVIVQAAGGRWTMSGPYELAALPDTVRTVIDARARRLGPQAGRVLSLAAVIGRDFDLDVLATAAATTDDELLDILDAATTAALVQEMTDVPGRYNFSHALIQHTLYEGLGPTRRARAHRQVAEALEQLREGRPEARVAELAHHWLNGSDVHKALEYSRRAAAAALSALAPAEALRYYTQAKNLQSQAGIDDEHLSIDLAIGLGTAQRQTGDHASRLTLLDAARQAAQLGDTDRLVAAVLANHRGLFSHAGTVDSDKVELLQLALERVPSNHPDRALLLATLCMELIYGSSLEQRRQLADEALALAHASGDPVVLVRVLNAVLYPLRVPELLDWSMEQSGESLRVAEGLGDPVQLFWAAHNRLGTAAWAQDIDEMDRCASIRDECADRLKQPMFDWVCCYMDSLRAQIAGDLDTAWQLVNRAETIATAIGEPDATVYLDVQNIAIMYQHGTLSDVIAPLEDAVDQTDESNRPLVGSWLAHAYAQADRLDDSSRLLETFASSGFQTARHAGWLSLMVSYAEIASQCQHRQSARTLFDLLAPWADQFTMPGITTDGPVSHSLATLAMTLGDYATADDYFARASEFSQRAHAKFFDARTDLWWANSLIARNSYGDKDRARTLLVAAHAAAGEHGYLDIERRAAKALRNLDEASLA